MADFARRYPEIVAKYVQFQQLTADPEVGDADKNAALRRLWLEEWFPLATADPAAAPALFAELFDGVDLDWRYVDYTNREAPVLDLRDQLPRITARSLVIAGRHDTMTVAKAEEMHAGINGSELLILEGSGHFAPVEEPAAFEQAVFDFLEVD
jgi:pimeloyl-ACP methyl ester carboxylesterase